ncbi:helix-turn-helix domain-containing protein [Aneurinibacillus danicus]|uniref:Mu DNA binding I gamma subdomain domain-containing protein n=1 Tax=Aneurinibacillus danicus TaxID=267746 RepID=A0A511V826_9BACL|nr:DNA-binding domain-containing protein [Aneurinibacillus danicus]GEN35094.1 hypothetical protein ADA01nite_25540 [Aneurinibacillus danicus]
MNRGGSKKARKPIATAVYDKFGERAYQNLMRRLELVQKAIALELERCTYDKKCILAMSAGVSVQTLYRWTDIYKKYGLLGLIPKKMRDELKYGKQAKQFRSMDRRAVEYIVSMYQQSPPPSVLSIYKKLLIVAEEKGWRIGSVSTCYRIIRQLASSNGPNLDS